MQDGKVEVLVRGTASTPIKQTVALVVNNALKEAGFSEVVFTHPIKGIDREFRSTPDVVSVLCVVAGTYPHLFTTPINVKVFDEPAVKDLSINDVGAHKTTATAIEEDKMVARQRVLEERLVPAVIQAIEVMALDEKVENTSERLLQ